LNKVKVKCNADMEDYVTWVDQSKIKRTGQAMIYSTVLICFENNERECGGTLQYS